MREPQEVARPAGLGILLQVSHIINHLWGANGRLIAAPLDLVSPVAFEKWMSLRDSHMWVNKV